MRMTLVMSSKGFDEFYEQGRNLIVMKKKETTTTTTTTTTVTPTTATMTAKATNKQRSETPPKLFTIRQKSDVIL